MNELIKKEISLNGNTNLITESGLANNHQIFAIGDSHSIFFYNSMKIKEHWCGGGHGVPITIFTLLESKLNLFEVGTLLGNGHEKYNIKQGDNVIFFYGFNDIQRNIYLHYNDNWKVGIKNLINKYINLLVNYKNIYKINIIVPSVYPNPRPNAEGQRPMGSYKQREQYCLYANDLLKEVCHYYNLKFLDIYKTITDENGFIRSNITKDNIHIDYDNDSIRTILEDKILELCE